jgi:hypothetical protein
MEDEMIVVDPYPGGTKYNPTSLLFNKVYFSLFLLVLILQLTSIIVGIYLVLIRKRKNKLPIWGTIFSSFGTTIFSPIISLIIFVYVGQVNIYFSLIIISLLATSLIIFGLTMLREKMKNKLLFFLAIFSLSWGFSIFFTVVFFLIVLILEHFIGQTWRSSNKEFYESIPLLFGITGVILTIIYKKRLKQIGEGLIYNSLIIKLIVGSVLAGLFVPFVLIFWLFIGDYSV